MMVSYSRCEHGYAQDAFGTCPECNYGEQAATTPSGRYRTLSPSGLVVEATPAVEADVGSPGPHKLHERAKGDTAKYRVLMLEHGYVLPLAPWERRAPGSKTARPCGLTHEQDWSPWFLYRQGARKFVARWCQTCALTEAWEAVDA